MDIFEKAARCKIRFESPVGLLSSEDLFSLPLTSTTGKANLDDIAKGLNRQVKNATEEVSFVNPSSTGANEILDLKFQVVKRVIEIRVEERDLKADETRRRDEKQKLLELIAKKKDNELEGKSVEELMAMVEKL